MCPGNPEVHGPRRNHDATPPPVLLPLLSFLLYLIAFTLAFFKEYKELNLFGTVCNQVLVTLNQEDDFIRIVEKIC